MAEAMNVYISYPRFDYTDVASCLADLLAAKPGVSHVFADE